MANKKLLICDLDNTLYDWVGYFVPSFYAMAEKAATIMSCSMDRLLDDFREIHQKYHDSEQPFALLETRAVKETFRNCSLAEITKELDPAFYAFNASRRANLRLNEGVFETLQVLHESGVTLIAHTESKLFGALDRLRRLKILEFFHKIYCRERSMYQHPDIVAGGRWLREFSLSNVRELSEHQSKPNPHVLVEICAAEGVSNEGAAYVGDSIGRDMLMAKRAGVFSIWAAYGASHDPKLYEALVRISHWTEFEVAREKRLRSEAASIQPDFVANESFRQVLSAIEFNGESLQQSLLN